jgi:hypothetical protein
MSIGPEEVLIEGAWVMKDGRLVSDANQKRIDSFATSELNRLGSASGGWEFLYRDPQDGRYWEMSFPRGEMHGGGPGLLRMPDGDEARKKYGSSVGDPQHR